MWDYKHCTHHQFKFSWDVKAAAGERRVSRRSTEGWQLPGHGCGRQEVPRDFSPWRLGLPGEGKAPGIALLTSGTEEPPPGLPLCPSLGCVINNSALEQPSAISFLTILNFFYYFLALFLLFCFFKFSFFSFFSWEVQNKTQEWGSASLVLISQCWLCMDRVFQSPIIPANN